jgi:hypothetical protein
VGYHVIPSLFYGYIESLEKSLTRTTILSFLLILKNINVMLEAAQHSIEHINSNSIQLNIEQNNLNQIETMINGLIGELIFFIELLDALISDLISNNISPSISTSNLEKKYPNFYINLEGIRKDFKDWLIVLIKQILTTSRPPSLPGIMAMSDESVKMSIDCFDSNIRTK